MFERNIVDFDAEWSIFDEDIMQENNDFENDEEEEMDDEYFINDDNEQQLEDRHEIEDREQSVYEHQSDDGLHRQCDDERSPYDERNNTHSDDKQVPSCNAMESGEDEVSSFSEEEYCPYCDGQTDSEEDESRGEQQCPYIGAQQCDNEESSAQSNELKLDAGSLLLTEHQPIDYSEGVQIKAFSVDPILPCGHKQEFSDEEAAIYNVEPEQNCEQTGKHFMISLPYRGNDGILFYRCLCGCSLVFDEYANLFFDMSNKSAFDVPDCKYHCPCGCNIMFEASDILLNPIYYAFYQKMVRNQFLNQCPINGTKTYSVCKQCVSKSNEYHNPIHEYPMDANYDADFEN